MSASNALAKKQYPPQTGKYKIVVKSGDDWRSFDQARFPISVGQPYHEGEKLKDTFAWAAARFEGISILLADTLQRFNLSARFGLSAEDAEKHARKLGDDWLQRNSPAIEASNISVNRWDDWRLSSAFTSAWKSVNDAYQEDHSFQTIVNETANRVCERSGNPSLFVPSCEYLLEETAVTALFSDASVIDLYPGSNFKGFDHLRDRPTKGLENYAQWRSARIHHLSR